MLKRTLLSAVLTIAAIAAAPGAAAAADAVVVPGADVRQLAALDDTVVWISGKFPDHTLMQRGPDGVVAPVTGAPRATYRSIDLGHDGSGELVLTYLRCAGTRDCRAYSDDLAGNRTRYRRLAPRGCDLTAAPARWGSRVAYGLYCSRIAGRPNPQRSGLYVRKGAGAAKLLRRPADAGRFGVDYVRFVDLRGTNVGAALTDIYSYAFSQTVNGSRLRSSFVAGSEGDSDEHVVGQSLGTGGVLWTLVDAIHAGDLPEARISQLLTTTSCTDSETLVSPAGVEGFRAEAMAVDGDTMYLFVAGTGIVTHEFNPTRTCS